MNGARQYWLCLNLREKWQRNEFSRSNFALPTGNNEILGLKLIYFYFFLREKKRKFNLWIFIYNTIDFFFRVGKSAELFFSRSRKRSRHQTSFPTFNRVRNRIINKNPSPWKCPMEKRSELSMSPDDPRVGLFFRGEKSGCLAGTASKESLPAVRHYFELTSVCNGRGRAPETPSLPTRALMPSR